MASEPSHPTVQSTNIPPPTSTPSNAPSPRVICVFCGSSPGTSPTHLAAARSLAQTLHAHSIHLVYGGGTVGLMGELARTLVSLSGPHSVTGIIPTPLMQFERAGRPGTTTTTSPSPPSTIDSTLYGQTTIVPDMHTRKRLMAKKVMEGGPGSGFVALSGGYGTLEELMEVVTWNQLGIHGRGVVVFNVEGYYDGLIEWVRTAVGAGFIAEGNKGILVEARDAEGVVRELEGYRPAEGRFRLDWSQN